MPRNTKMTLAATAVTLVCVGSVMYASPPVIAETLGRDISVLSLADDRSAPDPNRPADDEALDAATIPRQHSTIEVAPADVTPTTGDEASPGAPPASDASFGIAGSPAVPRVQATLEPSDDSSRELSTVEVVLPEPTPDTAEDSADPAIPEDLDSPDALTVIVNKDRPLPEDYEPEDLVELPTELGDAPYELREEAAQATQDMFAAAQADGIDLRVVSAYRSYDYQQQLYETYLAQHGETNTNNMSARPGYSEHQTGLAVDVDGSDGQHTLQQSFGDTEAGQWVAQHAPAFGFVIRYPEDAQEVTGFQYEPWHLRYFGEQTAEHIAENSGVAETTFDLDPAPDYDDES